MFGVNPSDLARSIRSSFDSALGSMGGGKAVAEPVSPWGSFFRELNYGQSGAAPQAQRSLNYAETAPRPAVQAAPAVQTALPDTGDVTQQRERALEIARQMFGDEAARVLNTTFDLEGGWNGAIGDTDINLAGSHGPLQFYGGGGQLNNFANQRNMGLEDAGRYVRANPLEAVKWALNGYYGSALRAGMDLGLKGPELAFYVQRNGQRSRREVNDNNGQGDPTRVYEAWRRLYGG